MKGLKYIIVFIAQILCCILSFAQTEKIDSLKKLLPSLSDTARIDCLNDISDEYFLVECRRHNSIHFYCDSMIYYSAKAYEESERINYIHGIAVSFSRNANVKLICGDNFKELERLSREALRWFELTSNKKNIEVAYFQLGRALFSQNRYDEASPYLERSYQWAEKNGNTNWMFYVLGFKYENYRDIGEYDKAFEAFQKNQQLQEQLYGKRDSFYECYVLAELHKRIGNYSTALNYYHKVIATMNLQNENIWYRVSYPELFTLNAQFDSARHYYNLIDSSKLTQHDLRFYLVSIGEFYLTQKEYKKAVDLLLRGFQYHLQAKDMTQANRALLNISKAYLALDDVGNALPYARKSMNISLGTHSKQYMRDAYQLLYNIYQRKHQSDSSFLYYQKYITQKEIVVGDVLKGQFAAYNYEQKIALLDKEKLAQQKQIKQTLRQKQMLITGIIMLFILGILLFRNILLKRKNEAGQRKIAENKLQIQKLESEKSKAEFQKKTTALEMQALRAQMNPHFIFNCLSSINRFILINKTEEASDYLTKFSRLIRMALINSEKSLITLESELEALRLYLDLERLRFKNAFNYSITFINTIDVNAVYIPPMLIQPFAENAIWHGLMHKKGVGSLEIQLCIENKTLTCVIMDDGIGRKIGTLLKSRSAEKNKSMGVQITAGRLALLNKSKSEAAIFNIEDLSDERGEPCGTKIILTMPYKDLTEVVA